MKAIKLVGIAALAAVSGLAQAADEGNWMVRARAIYMHPDNDNSGGLKLPMEVEADNKIFPELDVTYFFTPNIATELILTYPQKHDVTLGGTEIGTVSHLPPTLMLQYHFMPTSTIRPYAGLGLNYTRFSSPHLDAGRALGGSIPLRVDHSSFGWAAQVGADVQIAPKWYFNVDLKYVAIDADIYIKGGPKVTSLDVNPWLFAVGIGYRF